MQPDSTLAPRIGKTAAGTRLNSPERAVAWPEVLRCLSADETRSCVVQRLRQAGFTADDFASQRKARECVADALTAVEDRAETRRPKAQAERTAIRAVRRRLELELWP